LLGQLVGIDIEGQQTPRYHPERNADVAATLHGFYQFALIAVLLRIGVGEFFPAPDSWAFLPKRDR
jgi:hypothetical protein